MANGFYILAAADRDEAGKLASMIPANTVATIRADLLRRAGRPAEALDWYRTALDRNGSEPAREFLRRRVTECGGRV